MEDRHIQEYANLKGSDVIVVTAGLARRPGMSRDDLLVKNIGIIESVSIPVMAKVRIGHLSEASILESLGVDMLDESEGRHIQEQDL